MTTKRVVIVGLDGASSDLIFPWIDAGYLPTFKWITENGVAGPLWSVVPPVSPPAWTSFMTGCNPGKTGIFDFIDYVPTSYYRRPKFVNSQSIQRETIWELLSRCSRQVGVLYHPITYPPFQVNGFMVSGFLAPRSSAKFTYPADLWKELQQGDLWKLYRELADQETMEKNEYLEILDQMFSTTVKTTFHLLETRRCDCFMVVMHFTDSVSHFFWKESLSSPENNDDTIRYSNPILHYYQRSDDFLAQLLERLSEDTMLMLMSDHGLGPAFTRVVYINEWLRQRGYLDIRENGVSQSLLQLGISRDFLKGMARRMGLGSHIRRLSAKIPVSVKRKVPGQSLNLYDVNWANTRAYFQPFGYPWQGIWINTRGIKPQGIVEPRAEYEKLREELIEQIKDLRDHERDKAVVETALRREEVYNGPYTHLAPDILVRTADDYNGLPQIGQGVIADAPPQRWSGVHRDKGFWAASGPGIAQIPGQYDANLVDLAPTVLHYMGLPVPIGMDGCVLTRVLREQHPVSYSSDLFDGRQEFELSEDEEKELTKRLKDLGYL
jgi:predicted AlkP superfamily phosphohydrolase/phosphomutase